MVGEMSTPSTLSKNRASAWLSLPTPHPKSSARRYLIAISRERIWDKIYWISSARVGELDVCTSFLQHIPFSRRRYEAIVPLMPLAFESFDLRGFDLIVSSTHACAKGVLPPATAVHVDYCHTPMRYAWTHQEEYLARAPALVSPLARVVLNWL